MMADALPSIAKQGGAETLFISVAAGTPISQFEVVLGETARIIRAMPNTPAAIGQGITAIVGNTKVTDDQLGADDLLQAIGQTVRLMKKRRLMP